MTSFLALREVLVAKADFFAQRAMAGHRQSDSGLEKKTTKTQTRRLKNKPFLKSILKGK